METGSKKQKRGREEEKSKVRSQQGEKEVKERDEWGRARKQEEKDLA